MPQAQTYRCIPARSWVVLALAGIAGMLFYVDRQTVSVLKTTLQGSLGWSDAQYGWLTAGFMVSYMIGYFFAGRLIDRWGTRIMMPLFVAVMSLSALGTGLASDFWQFLLCRIALGAAGAGVVPSVMVTIFTWFPYDRRGTANMVNKPLHSGGNIIVVPLAVWLASALDWHWAFFVPAIAGVMLLSLWIIADRNPPDFSQPFPLAAAQSASTTHHTHPATGGTGYAVIVRNRALWGLVIARAISDPLWFFLMFWQPGYMQDILGMPLERLGQIGWIPFAVPLAFNMLLSLLSDKLIDRGWTPAASRIVILKALACLAPATLLLLVARDYSAVIIILCVVQTMAIGWFNLSNLLMTDLMPRQQVGTAVGIINACGAGTGALMNFFAGSFVMNVGYGPVFIACSLMHPIAALVIWWFYQHRKLAR